MLGTDEMPAKPATQQLSVRVEQELIEQLDALAHRLSRPGMPVSRADAMRVAMRAGIEVLNAAAQGSDKPK